MWEQCTRIAGSWGRAQWDLPSEGWELGRGGRTPGGRGEMLARGQELKWREDALEGGHGTRITTAAGGVLRFWGSTHGTEIEVGHTALDAVRSRSECAIHENTAERGARRDASRGGGSSRGLGWVHMLLQSREKSTQAHGGGAGEERPAARRSRPARRTSADRVPE